MSDEPTDDLAALDAEASDGVYESDEAALHGWMAVAQLPVALDLCHVVEQVRHEVGDLMDVRYTLEHMGDHEAGSDADHEFLDKLGDASKVLLAALQVELTSRDMGNAQLFVYFPCHKGFGIVAFNETTGPEIMVF